MRDKKDRENLGTNLVGCISDSDNFCNNYRYTRRRSSWSWSALSCSVILVLIFLCQLNSVSAIFFREFNEKIRNDLKDDRPCNFLMSDKDSALTTWQIVEKYGYPYERHWVTTEDGYILEVQRIPAKKGPDANGKSAPAIFLMHGILSTSRDWVINCDRRALAFELWENGYDVWMGNYRGNPYCRNHTHLKPNSVKFWDFSADQIGYYDGPAMIDHILNTTGLTQVSYVGHSMGNGIALIMLTTRPEYNDKVNEWFALSAAASLQNTGSPLLRIFAAFPRSVEWLLTKFNHGELLPPAVSKLLNRFLPILCRREGRTVDYHGFCSFLDYINDGYDPGQIIPAAHSVVTGTYPTSTAAKFVVQWMQWIISGNFAMFDHGPRKNLVKYGSVKPKPFPIENLRTPTILFWGENDWIVSAPDIKKTEKIVKLIRPGSPPPFKTFKVANPRWNHADFLYGKDADVLVYCHILKRLREIYPDHDLSHNGVTRESSGVCISDSDNTINDNDNQGNNNNNSSVDKIENTGTISSSTSISPIDSTIQEENSHNENDTATNNYEEGIDDKDHVSVDTGSIAASIITDSSPATDSNDNTGNDPADVEVNQNPTPLIDIRVNES